MALIWLRRILAVGHVGWAILLLLGAGWFAFAALSTLPHLTSVSPLIRFGAIFPLLLSSVAPPVALGAWLAVLGRRLWTGRSLARATLIVTHVLLLVLGATATAVGFAAVDAAARSAARGGGLMGPVAYIPILFGLPSLTLAAATLGAAHWLGPARAAVMPR